MMELELLFAGHVTLFKAMIEAFLHYLMMTSSLTTSEKLYLKGCLHKRARPPIQTESINRKNTIKI